RSFACWQALGTPTESRESRSAMKPSTLPPMVFASPVVTQPPFASLREKADVSFALQLWALSKSIGSPLPACFASRFALPATFLRMARIFAAAHRLVAWAAAGSGEDITRGRAIATRAASFSVLGIAVSLQVRAGRTGASGRRRTSRGASLALGYDPAK